MRRVCAKSGEGGAGESDSGFRRPPCGGRTFGHREAPAMGCQRCPASFRWPQPSHIVAFPSTSLAANEAPIPPIDWSGGALPRLQLRQAPRCCAMGKAYRGAAKRRGISLIEVVIGTRADGRGLRVLIERRRTQDRRPNQLYNLPAPTLGASMRTRASTRRNVSKAAGFLELR